MFVLVIVFVLLIVRTLALPLLLSQYAFAAAPLLLVAELGKALGSRVLLAVLPVTQSHRPLRPATLLPGVLSALWQLLLVHAAPHGPPVVTLLVGNRCDTGPPSPLGGALTTAIPAS